jgi:hypothetical protein
MLAVGADLLLPHRCLRLEFVDEPFTGLEPLCTVPTPYMDADDRLPGMHNSTSMGYSDSRYPELLDALLCQFSENLNQLLRPYIEFQMLYYSPFLDSPG